MTDLVIDASVALKWIVAEEGSTEALALRRQRLFAPDLLVAECANALWKKVQRDELTIDEAVIAARLLQRADIEMSPMLPLLEPAIRLAVTLNHPAYDCVYLALAEAMACDLVTADARLVAKAAAAGRKDVRILTNPGLP